MNPEEREPGASGRVRRARRLPSSFSEESMKQVWLDSRDSKLTTAGKPGIDGHTASEFHHNIDSNVRKIRRLVQTGDYHFSRLRIAPIEKADGTKRIIAVPTVQDRFVQRVVLSELNSQKGFQAHCLANHRSLAHISRDLESITVGYERAMAVAEDRESFSARLEASKRRALAFLLTELFGAKYVSAMTDDDKAILGLADFGSSHRKAA